MKVICEILFIPIVALIAMCVLDRNKQSSCLGKRRQFIRSHLVMWVLLLITNSVSLLVCMNNEKQEEHIYVEKDSYGGEDRQYHFLLSKDGERKEVEVGVSPKRLKDSEIKKKMKQAFDYIDNNLKGENEDLFHVTQNLNLELDSEKFPFQMECISNCYGLVDGYGLVKNENKDFEKAGFSKSDAQSGIPVEFTVTLIYGEQSRKQTFSLIVFPKPQTELEMQFAGVIEEIEKKDKAASYEDGFWVPSVVKGVSVKSLDENGIQAYHVWLFGIVVGALLLIREKEEERTSIRRKKEELLRLYPWFVNQLNLMLGAGMQIKNIFRKMVCEYDEKKDATNQKVLMDELKIACRSFDVGIHETQVYYRLGRRIGIPCYIKLMTLLEQNIKRGSKGIMNMLEHEEIMALEERKNLAKKLGEEAGTKLLGPMMLLLTIILLIIMLPAFMCFQS